MEYRKLGNTDIDVSVICLGTMTWGQQNTEEEGFEQMDYAVEQGVNFFDTAELYSIPPMEDTQGRNETRLDSDNITKAIEGSLKRLKTDYVDLYQLHWPDRPINLFGGGLSYKHYDLDSVAIEETLRVLGDLVKEGKIRYVGLSNETPWGLSEFIKAAEMHDLPKVVSVQNAYNLLNRIYESGMSEFHHRSQVGLLAYSPLAQGYLTGKYLDGARPAGARTTLFERGQRYETEQAEEIIRKYVNLANEYSMDPALMANSFVNDQDFVTSNIIGATTMEQLKIAVGSIDTKLDEECLKKIEEIHYGCPNPCP